MAAIDKAAFLKRIAGGADPEYSGDAVAGESDAAAAPEGDDEASEGMTCGEQLMAAVNAGDAAGVDAALREAVAKYGK